MATATKASEKHRFSQFLPHYLHKRVVAHVKAQKRAGVHTSVTEEIEKLVRERFSGKQ